MAVHTHESVHEPIHEPIHEPVHVWRTFAAKITFSYLLSYYAILILHSATCMVYSAT